MSEVKVTNDGKILYDGQPATNEQLSEYFDFAKYTDVKEQRYVEGILKSNTVTVNGTKYSSIMDNNGYLVSEDGQSKLSPSKAKEIFGEKGYNALVAKKTKNITVDDNGVTVNDGNSEGFKIDDGTIEQNNTDNQNSEAPEETKPEEQQEETKEKEKEEEKKEENKEEQKNNDDTPKSGNSSSGGHSTSGGGHSSSGGGHSSSGGGYTPSPSYSSDTSSESPTISPVDETTEEESTEKTEDSSDKKEKKEEKEDSIIKTKTGGKEKIVVDFDALNGLKDDLKTCGTEIQEQFTTYKTNINSVSSSGAWSGEDADAYITAKNKYATSAETITETFNNFTSYLEKCIDQYQALENELSAKFG